jgi:hypothetical protein
MSGGLLLAILLAGAGSAGPLAAAPGWDVQLSPESEPGERLVIEGRVLGKDGKPDRDVQLFAYHADAKGVYSARGEEKPRIAGVLRPNVLGEFRIRTIMPGRPEGVPHVHFEIARRGRSYRAITLSFCRSVGAGSDTTLAQLPWMVDLPEGGGWAYLQRNAEGTFHCRWDLELRNSVAVAGHPEYFGRNDP